MKTPGKYRHWNLKYIFDRTSLFVSQKRNPDDPWLTPAMNHILDGWLKSSDRGLECGAGRSTIWLAQRLECLFSIEENAEWFSETQRLLKSRGLTNVQQVLATDDDTYVRAIERIDSSSLDFVLVDGRARARCAIAAVEVLRSGGIIVLDDAQRYLPSASQSPNAIPPFANPPTSEWQSYQDVVRTWRRIWTSSGVSDTCFWQKP